MKSSFIGIEIAYSLPEEETAAQKSVQHRALAVRGSVIGQMLARAWGLGHALQRHPGTPMYVRSGGSAMRREIASLLVVTLCFLGCASAYDRTYDQELGRLRNQERQRQDMEAADRAEAQRYVAVVYFSVGSSMIQEEGFHELLWFADKIGPYRHQAYIDVKGYADSSGHEQFNQELSNQRAKNVADFLAQQGIPYDRISPAGFSTNFPDEPNDTAQGRSRNRRAEVRVR
jgi:outer membrane protein OmpA-like peptidoglycan-associated protein